MNTPLFPPDYADPINPYDLVTRFPGLDAPCICETNANCGWPWCDWHRHAPRPDVSSEDAE